MREVLPLTSIRGLAALWVVLMHIYAPLVDNTFIYYFFRNGGQGVTFFFVLSGFILSYVYCDKFQKINWDKYCNFIHNRIARVYPLHFTTLLICLLLYKGISSDEIFQNLLLIQGWGVFGLNKFSCNTGAWSISVEFFLYLFFPFFIYFINKTNKITRFIFLFSACLLFNNFTFEPLFPNLPFLVWGNEADTLYAGKKIYFYGIYFFLGALTHLCFKDIPEGKIWDLGCIIAFIMIILLFSFKIFTLESWYFRASFVPYLILVISLCKTTGFFKNLFSRKSFVFLGEISFSIYLTHGLVLTVMLYFVPIFSELPIFGPYIYETIKFLSILAIIPVSAFFYYYIEKPARKFFRSHLLDSGKNSLNDLSLKPFKQ